jgi:hypothetical protein
MNIENRMRKLEASITGTPYGKYNVSGGFIFVAYEPGGKNCPCGNWFSPGDQRIECGVCGTPLSEMEIDQTMPSSEYRKPGI